MNYICNHCGKLICEDEYNNCKIDSKYGGLSIATWFFIIFLFISIILAPIALIILLASKKHESACICPYCKAKDTLLPEDSPIAKKLIKENYTENDLELFNNFKKPENNEPKKLGLFIGIALLILYIFHLINTFIK